MYALRTGRNWGAGDFTDLANLSSWLRSLGGRLVGTLPPLAAFLDDPYEPSPYAPVSRLFWNELYVDVQRVPELEHSPAALEILSAAGFQQELNTLSEDDHVHYDRVMALKRQVLSQLSADFFALGSPRFDEFTQFADQHAHLHEYGAFRAVYERRREPWHTWPDRLREGRLTAEDYDQPTAAYHCYVQWIAHQQLEELSQQSAAAGDGLYLDLPLGARADGFDVWRNQQSFSLDATAGAPPDAVFTKGQDWGFPPLHPLGIRSGGYRHMREYLNHHMKLAHTLRIDHVMGLHRLYWIPRGMPASQGVYVRYQPDEMYAVLSLESQRSQTTVIGENLGTVPKVVNESMHRHGVRRMFVVQYELDSDEQEPLSDIPRDCVASLNTHDMPTFSAWWRGLDLPQREELGLMNHQEALQERHRREQIRSQLTAWLQSTGWLKDGEDADEAAVLVALLIRLAASDAEAVLVNLEDLWQETRPQNVPGTGPELPNWKRKAAVTFEELADRADFTGALESVAKLRQAWVQKPSSRQTTRVNQKSIEEIA